MDTDFLYKFNKTVYLIYLNVLSITEMINLLCNAFK